MIKKAKQINKGTVKPQINKSEPKKKLINKPIVYECLCCSKKVIGIEKPTECPCSNPNYVISLGYKVVD